MTGRFEQAVRAAGALAVEIDLGAGQIRFGGPASGLGLETGPDLARFREAIAPADRAALDALSRAGRLDIRIRLVGTDSRVRHVRLRGSGDGARWHGLLLPAGAGPDGGRARIEREAALTRGLEEGRVIAFHQPIIDLATGRLAGFEALARWDRPGEGLIAPDDFLPMAAQMGLTRAIGDAVRKSAIGDLSAWRASGTAGRLYVAANATAGELCSDGFARTLIEQVRNAGLPPGAFKLEINETELMSDPDAVGAVCRELKQAGIALVLDDFGTGYSSLARLDRLPFDILKIDQYFIRAMMADAAARAIVSSVVSLARHYAMTVVAEGVESAAMAEIAAGQGCDFAQGFHYAGALSPPEAETVAREGRPPLFAPAG